MSEQWGVGIEDTRQNDGGTIVVVHCNGCDHQWLADDLEFCPDCGCGDMDIVPPDDIDDWEGVGA